MRSAGLVPSASLGADRPGRPRQGSAVRCPLSTGQALALVSLAPALSCRPTGRLLLLQ